VTRDFDLVTIFPAIAAVQVRAPAGWHAAPLVESSPDSWIETGPLSGTVIFDPGTDTRGPVPLAMALTRPVPGVALPSIYPASPEQDQDAGTEGAPPSVPEQRVVVFGDSDFLSDTFVGNGGNLDLGLNLVNWLVHDESLINIPARVAPDVSLHLSPTALLVLTGVFLILLPLTLVGTGMVVWWRRRKA
jgi:ABC-type uncharacterized transport system involved in gliding motility auxiliary subunit